jgi:hypothetical protein
MTCYVLLLYLTFLHSHFTGPDKGSYFHSLFVHGRPILSTMMKRVKIKGIKTLQEANANAVAAAMAQDEDETIADKEVPAAPTPTKKANEDKDDEDEADVTSESDDHTD